MPKAVLKNGVIYPLELLPAEWRDGQELDVRESTLDAAEADAWFARMEALVADMTPEEDACLQAAVEDVRRQAKELARRKGGEPSRAGSCSTPTT
jgi:hypothetical protein